MWKLPPEEQQLWVNSKADRTARTVFCIWYLPRGEIQNTRTPRLCTAVLYFFMRGLEKIPNAKCRTRGTKQMRMLYSESWPGELPTPRQSHAKNTECRILIQSAEQHRGTQQKYVRSAFCISYPVKIYRFAQKYCISFIFTGRRGPSCKFLQNREYKIQKLSR